MLSSSVLDRARSWLWEEPIAQFSVRGWRCVAYDHRGSGKSPGVRSLVEFEGSGHVPTMTRPTDVVDAILRRFS